MTLSVNHFYSGTPNLCELKAAVLPFTIQNRANITARCALLASLDLFTIPKKCEIY